MFVPTRLATKTKTDKSVYLTPQTIFVFLAIFANPLPTISFRILDDTFQLTLTVNTTRTKFDAGVFGSGRVVPRKRRTATFYLYAGIEAAHEVTTAALTVHGNGSARCLARRMSGPPKASRWSGWVPGLESGFLLFLSNNSIRICT